MHHAGRPLLFWVAAGWAHALWTQPAPPTPPPAFAELGLPVDVVVDYDLGFDGEPREINVVSAPHPAYADAALAWLAGQRLKGGGAARSGRKRETITFPAAPAGDFTAPPRLLFARDPVFPPLMLRARLSGLAEVRVQIGADGRVERSELVAADREAFGLALAAAVDEWLFQPAARGDAPVAAACVLRYAFAYDDVPESTRLWAQRHSRGELLGHVVPPGRLDSPPQLVEQPEAPAPSLLDVLGLAGSATVLAVVEADGRVAYAREEDFTHPAFGASALAAVRQYVYRPPTVGGQPVATELRLRLDFAGGGRARGAAAAPRLLGGAGDSLPAPAETSQGPLVARTYEPPQYPRECLLDGTEGYVLLRLEVDAAGKVTGVRVAESSDRRFDTPALRAARRWTFYPRVVNGEPVPTTENYRLEFRLE